MPLDRIEMPDTDDLPPLKDLVQKALVNRSDLAEAKANVNTAEVSAIGTKNGVLPTLQVIGGESQAGLSGTVASPSANPYFVGNVGTALAQAIRRNFPTERIGAFLQAPHRQPAGAGRLWKSTSFNFAKPNSPRRRLSIRWWWMRRTTLSLCGRRGRAAIGRAVPEPASWKNKCSMPSGEDSLWAHRRRYNVIQQQRDLASARATEVSAMGAYSSARIALDSGSGRDA